MSIDDKLHGADHASPVGESVEESLSACLQKCIEKSQGNACVGVTFRHEKTTSSGGNPNCWLKGATTPRHHVDEEDELHVNFVSVININTCMHDIQCKAAYNTAIFGAVTGAIGAVGALGAGVLAAWRFIKKSMCMRTPTAPIAPGSSHSFLMSAGTTIGRMHLEGKSVSAPAHNAPAACELRAVNVQ
jgi:hypothetical protein